MRSVGWDRAESAKRARDRPLARWPYQPHEHRREQPNIPDEVADRVVFDDLATLAAQAIGDGEQLAVRVRGILVGRPEQAGLGRSGASADRASSQRVGFRDSWALPR